ncbi:MAG TPA: hypothetical protein VI749_09080 [Candidatus Omnitrophota bacterium]|nr:hypothetical protein [Candidatus Omnitrophota bacterium]
MKTTRYFLIIAVFFILSLSLQAQESPHVVVFHKNQEQVVYYDLYIPPSSEKEKMPVLVCTGGLPIIDGRYVHSDTKECSGKEWTDFADRNKIAILGLGFLFKEEDWKDQTSYQFPKAWSGRALNQVLNKLVKDHPIDNDQLYMFGISAGAQYSTRFGLLNPKRVKAVASHAAGGYDAPQRHVPVKFLLTVGELDNDEISRVEWAKYFMEKAGEKGIDVRLEIISGIAHRQTQGQNEMSRQFFEGVLKENR